MSTTGSQTAIGLADTLLKPAEAAVAYANELCKDIPEDRFACMPEGVKTNSPAWVIGHLSIYPDFILSSIGRTDVAESVDDLSEHFAPGVECVDDPQGVRYPSKDVLLSRFNARYRALLDLLPEVTAEQLQIQPENERLREMFGNMGGLITFLATGHTMMHLGQVSAWRRVMGMGSAL